MCVRAYVEFYRSSLRVSGVLPEVSLSLLLNQQRVPLHLHVHPAEEVETWAGGQSVSHLRYTRYTYTLLANSEHLNLVLNITLK